MKIVELTINEFGKLRDKTFNFDQAITIIQGDNESGKSTLLSFIKYMLYGLPKRSRAETVSATDRALNWESESAGGSMTVIHEGKLYRIDRKSIKTGAISKAPVTKYQITDCESGLPIADGSSAGEFFLGITYDMFEATCGISQLGCAAVKGEEITASLQNLVSSADETLDAQKAVRALEKARVKYLHKNGKGGSIYELENRKYQLEQQYRRALDDLCEIEKLEKQLFDTEEKMAEISKHKKVSDELCDKINLLTVLKLFDKLHEYEDESEKLRKQEEELVLGIEKDGFIPDQSFLSALNTTRLEISLAKEELASAKKALEDAQTLTADESEELQKAGVLTELGGKEAIQNKFKEHKATSRLFVTLSVISTAIAAISALVWTLVWPIAIIPTIVFILITVLSFCIKFTSRSAKAVKEIYSRLGCDKDSVDELIERYSAILQKHSELSASFEKLKAEIAIKEKMLAISVSRAKTVSARYIDCDDLSADDLENELCSLSERVSRYLDEMSSLGSKIALCEDKIAQLSKDLKEYNEHQIRGHISKDILSMSEEEFAEAQRKKNFYDIQLHSLASKKALKERSMLEKKYGTKDPFEIFEMLEHTEKELNIQKGDYDAVTLAIDAINTAMANMKNTVTPRLRGYASDYLSLITSDKYSSLGMSEDLELSMSDNGFSHHIDMFSTGTKDAAYIALRLSLLKLIPCPELAPVFMDETFAMIDDTRTVSLMRVLKEYCDEGGQCIIFTCHDREKRLCEDNGIEYSSLTL